MNKNDIRLLTCNNLYFSYFTCRKSHHGDAGVSSDSSTQLLSLESATTDQKQNYVIHHLSIFGWDSEETTDHIQSFVLSMLVRKEGKRSQE